MLTREECMVCYEPTEDRTECNHILCNGCKSTLKKEECPYCRQKIRTWDSKLIKIPFYHFVNLFHDYYNKSNAIYRNLFIGIEYEDILCDKIYYVFEEEYDNCTWTENYNCAITLKIYNIWKLERGRIRIEFTTEGLDNDQNIRHYYIFQPNLIYDPYLQGWIRKYLRV